MAIPRMFWVEVPFYSPDDFCCQRVPNAGLPIRPTAQYCCAGPGKRSAPALCVVTPFLPSLLRQRLERRQVFFINRRKRFTTQRHR
ncbi:hypothetical protein KCP77_04700 [Salmonella enterica subsp. enterica]|nr:hypothetical protein KCP77_04700 [Salmonella enterica subsp. enterica]